MDFINVPLKYTFYIWKLSWNSRRSLHTCFNYHFGPQNNFQDQRWQSGEQLKAELWLEQHAQDNDKRFYSVWKMPNGDEAPKTRGKHEKDNGETRKRQEGKDAKDNWERWDEATTAPTTLPTIAGTAAGAFLGSIIVEVHPPD